MHFRATNSDFNNTPAVERMKKRGTL